MAAVAVAAAEGGADRDVTTVLDEQVDDRVKDVGRHGSRRR
jgi:hypothetical protein